MGGRRTRWVKEGAIVRERENRKNSSVWKKTAKRVYRKVKGRTRGASLRLEEESQLDCGEQVKPAFWFVSRIGLNPHVTSLTPAYNALAPFN